MVGEISLTRCYPVVILTCLSIFAGASPGDGVHPHGTECTPVGKSPNRGVLIAKAERDPRKCLIMPVENEILARKKRDDYQFFG